MGRTPSKTDEKLIKAGVALARKKGLSGFTVREVCAKSGVNLGMFHYCFKTKECFDRAVLKTLYRELMDEIVVEVSPDKSARSNVAYILKSINAFAQKNRILLSALVGDVFAGNKSTLAFLTGNFTEHMSVLLQELRRAQAEGEVPAGQVFALAIELVAPVVLPQLVLGLMSRMEGGVAPRVKALLASAAFDRTADERIKLALRGVFGGQA